MTASQVNGNRGRTPFVTKLLVLSDSHGGRAAIERVLMKESKSIDALIFLATACGIWNWL